ncbi:hypothetical protein CR203_03570 [Salipaludibacillus neizhouensis]|uniref:ATP-grasp domain-containing protein n=1 Tax=Salipaludibacillus neizhouensis TaxID=885475 RepID=A0A3A9K9F1_9BACI|nr:YheC/YheD family protein [Salipaludibacillus neizhouensis]RKL69127.1 hypothetical protein CR203_03570 [Salipaludibacillus neizhouensis]
MTVRLTGRNKYKMYLALKKNKNLLRHLPDTKMWSKVNFYNMLEKYKSIVVKPNNGQQGQRIYFVKAIKSRYELYINKKRKVFKKKKDLYNYIRIATLKRRFIIQREVDLAKIEGKRFDFRIIVQRKTRMLPWVVNGVLVRKAGKGYKVTNRRRHGIVLSLEDALKSMNVTNERKEFKVKEIQKISHMAAETLGRSFPNQRIFGVDIGMKEDGSLYIFELNRWPLLHGFRLLKDKSYIRKIMTYKSRRKG